MTVALAAADPLRTLAEPFVPEDLPGRLPTRGTRLYATVCDPPTRKDGIGVYQWQGDAWRRQQWLPAEGAGPMLADPEGQRLFVAHRAASTGMPAGSAEMMRIDPRTGLLTRGEQQPLALSSRHPVAMALSPDRQVLAVVAAGGVFSLLPVQSDGTLGEVRAAYKHLALPISHTDKASLRFEAAPPESGDGKLQPVQRLSLQLEMRCLEYECAPDGLTFASSREAQFGSPSEADIMLPGVRTFVLQPPLV
ncbi:lactonase family protein [Terriglobus aquaticus]|uniref:WD40-like Beta Propeller Repeat n=1 Tax=Terriglobus aquaticus TaxID=940139 RepID=A0ABW9KJC6_9BACT|nr:hypothetical protein [Terriglobus aquaticus]